MLKFTYLAQLGLAGTVLVPAVVLEQDPAGGLTDALANTTATIESLERLHTALTDGDHRHVSAALEATEAPVGDAQQRDEHLSYLRDEVSRLQMRWETLEGAMKANASTVKPSIAPAITPTAELVASPAPIATPLSLVTSPTEPVIKSDSPTTTGMSETTREDIVQRLSPQKLATAKAVNTAKTHFEPSGFSAHAVRHGRALYKAGRYTDAIALLSTATTQTGASFWIACSLEKLGRIDEAITAYDQVIENVTDAKDAQHAKRNRDFLIWKRDFDARISITTAGNTQGEAL